MTAQNMNKKKFPNSMPETDEGWWASVLAEEEQHSTLRSAVAASKPKLEMAQEVPEPSSAKPTTLHVDWDVARKLYAEDGIIDIQVTGHNHGGLLVEKDGLAGFVPFSHLVELAGREQENDRDTSLDEYTGKTLRVKMIECVPEDGRVVFSERAALTAPGKRMELFHTLANGDQVTGTVTNITDFGIFIDLGGVEGLIHLSELSWGRVTHPKNIARLGETLKVLVLDISVERNRVALSLKRLKPNPWERAETEFPVGKVLACVVTTVLSYGAFVSLESGVEGLVHASEMMLKENQSPRDVLVEGQKIEVRVLHVDSARQRLGLSMKLNLE